MPERTEALSIVVPAHNESENLAILLPRLRLALEGTGDGYEVLVVDNASTDDTASVVIEFGRTSPEFRLIAEPALGYGRAVLSGLRASRGAVIGIIRADNQEKPEDLSVMYLRMKEKGFDFLKAIRAHREGDGVRRVVVSFVYNALFKLFFRLRSRDLNATPKLFTRAFYEAAHLESKDWFIDAEMVLKAERLGFHTGEWEIAYLPRLKGTSNVRLRHVFEFIGNMLQWWIRLYRGHLLEK